jgi:hypothetical protein
MIRNLYSSVKASIVKQKGATYEPSREEIADNVFQLIHMSKLNLHDAGYFTSNLWHIDDVMESFECTEEQAMDVLQEVMTNGEVIHSIFEEIFNKCTALGYNRREDEEE